MYEKNDLEAKLSEALVPVEPSTHFTRSLRARLVNYEGGQPISGWTLLVLIGTGFLLILTSFGLFFRIVLSLIAILGFLGERRRRSSGTRIAIS
ncbi:MAG: hypothetical protein ACERKX_03875 [Anaerolineales bacterium]|jgi:hypothetical protein